jgi:hypothetical protein
MNERIKEFISQVDWSTDTTDSELEKFAGLIVKECADLVDRAMSDGGVDGRVVKEHFGVAE